MIPSPGFTFPWWYSRKNHVTWARVRQQGAARFILVHGAAWYGGMMFLFMGLLLPMASQSWQMPGTRDIALSALIWAVAGVIWGASIWHLSERNFRKYSALTGTNQP